MSEARHILETYQTRMIALKDLYRKVARDCSTLVEDFKDAADSAKLRHSSSDAPFKIDFFRIDQPTNTHFRIVASTGVLMVSFDNPTGYVGAMHHYYNSEEVADSQRFYTYLVDGGEQKLVQIDGTAVTEFSEGKIARLLIEELLVPTLHPERVASGITRELDRTRELMRNAA